MALHHHPISTVRRSDERYPRLLAASPASPSQLWIQGVPAVLSRRHLAIIGSREIDDLSAHAASAVAEALRDRGWGVVSGGALGADAVGHRSALSHAVPTVMVLANGLGTVYPASHSQMAEEILVAGGALVSEQEPGARACAQYLVARNRIIVGLSHAVVVLQARRSGGTLHAVRQSIEAGRPVFCVKRGDADAFGSDALLQRPAAAVVEELAELRGLRRRLGAQIDPDQPLARPLPQDDGQLLKLMDMLAEPEVPRPVPRPQQGSLF